jgi:hypothetical protein
MIFTIAYRSHHFEHAPVKSAHVGSVAASTSAAPD